MAARTIFNFIDGPQITLTIRSQAGSLPRPSPFYAADGRRALIPHECAPAVAAPAPQASPPLARPRPDSPLAVAASKWIRIGFLTVRRESNFSSVKDEGSKKGSIVLFAF